MSKLFILFALYGVFYSSTLLAKTCPKGEHWVDAYHRNAYIRYDGVHVSATEVSAHCRRNPRGYDQWNQRLSNHRPKIWGYTKEKSKQWSTEDIQRVYTALSILPDQLLQLTDVKVHRMISSKFSENPATTNPPLKDVTLYDLAFVYKESLAQVLSHELSHILFENMAIDDKRNFAEKAGWSSKSILGKEHYLLNKNKINIKEDSRDSLEEDFANHIELYLFQPSVVKAKSNDAFIWIQNKYGKNFKIKKEGP